jgi:hypothetical protein
MKRSNRWTKALGPAAIAVVLVGCGSGGDGPLAEVRWGETEPASGRVVDGAVELSADGSPATFPLTVIEEPGVGGTGYALEGEVRYEDVGEVGYLEMWSVFPDGARYFSRTLATDGPMANLVGDSDWREFQLPFFLEGATTMPSRLELNMVLPSTGRVWVGPVRLVAIGDAGDDAWWTDRTAGVVGGFGGALIGVFGGMVGTLAPRGKARRLVLGTLVGLTALGGVLLVAGAIAFFGSQPYAVTGTLLISGGILATVPGGLIARVRQAYAQAELRRMRALDAA